MTLNERKEALALRIFVYTKEQGLASEYTFRKLVHDLMRSRTEEEVSSLEQRASRLMTLLN